MAGNILGEEQTLADTSDFRHLCWEGSSGLQSWLGRSRRPGFPRKIIVIYHQEEENREKTMESEKDLFWFLITSLYDFKEEVKCW